MQQLPHPPSGIFIQNDFITPDHESSLIHIFTHDLTWPQTSSSNTRRSLHYGYSFSYKTFSIDPSSHTPFPHWLTPLLPTFKNRAPDQVCLQHYPPGTGIPPHVDTHSAFEDHLYALSLGAPVIMQFAEKNNKGGGAGRKVDVDLKGRSMMRMEGEGRLHWTHGIRARKTDGLEDGRVRRRGDRWSITFRWVREGGVCECGDERLCDTAMGRVGVGRVLRWKEDEEKEKQEEEEEEMNKKLEDGESLDKHKSSTSR